MAAPDFNALLDAYKPIQTALDAALAEQAKLNIPVLQQQRDAAQQALLASMQENFPYVYDDGHYLVKSRTWLLGRPTLSVLQTKSPAPPKQPGFLSSSFLQIVATALITAFLVNGPPKGCSWPTPSPVPPAPGPVVPDVPTPKPPDPGVAKSDAYKAGKDYHDAKLVALIGNALKDSGAQIKAGASLAAAKAAQREQLKKLLTPEMSTNLTTLLDKVLPPGADPDQITPEQRRQYGDILIDFGQALLDSVRP